MTAAVFTNGWDQGPTAMDRLGDEVHVEHPRSKVARLIESSGLASEVKADYGRSCRHFGIRPLFVDRSWNFGSREVHHHHHHHAGAAAEAGAVDSGEEGGGRKKKKKERASLVDVAMVAAMAFGAVWFSFYTGQRMAADLRLDRQLASLEQIGLRWQNRLMGAGETGDPEVAEVIGEIRQCRAMVNDRLWFDVPLMLASLSVVAGVAAFGVDRLGSGSLLAHRVVCTSMITGAMSMGAAVAFKPNMSRYGDLKRNLDDGAARRSERGPASSPGWYDSSGWGPAPSAPPFWS